MGRAHSRRRDWRKRRHFCRTNDEGALYGNNEGQPMPSILAGLALTMPVSTKPAQLPQFTTTVLAARPNASPARLLHLRLLMPLRLRPRHHPHPCTPRRCASAQFAILQGTAQTIRLSKSALQPNRRTLPPRRLHAPPPSRPQLHSAYLFLHGFSQLNSPTSSFDSLCSIFALFGSFWWCFVR